MRESLHARIITHDDIAKIIKCNIGFDLMLMLIITKTIFEYKNKTLMASKVSRQEHSDSFNIFYVPSLEIK